MKIACLQFAPEVGKLEENIAKAEKILENDDNVSSADVLVLPELALTGYNFPSLEAITPFLEPTKAGPSTKWATKIAQKLNCIVIIGYPELDITESSIPSTLTSLSTPNDLSKGPIIKVSNPISISTSSDASTTPLTSPKRYNSLVAVSPAGTVLAHYRKSFLYYTDETWASESPTGFTTIPLTPTQPPPPPSSPPSPLLATYLSRVAPGICMDINPHRFVAPWTAFEYASHVLASAAQTAMLSMAWLVQATPAAWAIEMAERGGEVEVSTLSYWVERLKPMVDGGGGTTLVVCANRVGIEGEACYAGSSCVMRVGGGRVEILGMLGRGEEAVLVVDVEGGVKYTLRMEADGEEEARRRASEVSVGWNA